MLLPPTSGAPAARENACSARMRSGVVAACLRMIVSGVREFIFLARFYMRTMSNCSWLYALSTWRETGLPMKSDSIARPGDSSSRNMSMTC
jgi:hypothetical protein